jgi:hypothetical protein
MDQVRGYGLTKEQMAFFRAANEPFLPAEIQDLLNTDASQSRERAREALIQADGATAEHIAELLTRSVISQDDTYLRTIGAYNRANTGSTPVSPPSEPEQRFRRLAGRAARLDRGAGIPRKLQCLAR